MRASVVVASALLMALTVFAIWGVTYTATGRHLMIALRGFNGSCSGNMTACVYDGCCNYLCPEPTYCSCQNDTCSYDLPPPSASRTVSFSRTPTRTPSTSACTTLTLMPSATPTPRPLRPGGAAAGFSCASSSNCTQNAYCLCGYDTASTTTTSDSGSATPPPQLASCACQCLAEATQCGSGAYSVCCLSQLTTCRTAALGFRQDAWCEANPTPSVSISPTVTRAPLSSPSTTQTPSSSLAPSPSCAPPVPENALCAAGKWMMTNLIVAASASRAPADSPPPLVAPPVISVSSPVVVTGNASLSQSTEWIVDTDKAVPTITVNGDASINGTCVIRLRDRVQNGTTVQLISTADGTDVQGECDSVTVVEDYAHNKCDSVTATQTKTGGLGVLLTMERDAECLSDDDQPNAKSGGSAKKHHLLIIVTTTVVGGVLCVTITIVVVALVGWRRGRFRWKSTRASTTQEISASPSRQRLNRSVQVRSSTVGSSQSPTDQDVLQS